MTISLRPLTVLALMLLVFGSAEPSLAATDSVETALEAITGPERPPAPARAREQAAEEDPLTQRQTEAEEDAEPPPDAKPAPEPNELAVYGSLRVRYRWNPDSEGFEDGSSRIGLQGRYQLRPRKWLFARAEAGFNLLDEVSALAGSNANNPGGGRGDTFFRRLLYVGYESPRLFLIAGKAWSVYYKVTGFTDRFAGSGGSASGTYNAGTDGGYTGTGRAENALQTRMLIDFLPEPWGIEPFGLNIQLQDGEPIPGVAGHRYGRALGLSALLDTRQNFSLGIAYNHAQVPDADEPELRARGIDGDARALALGARWFDDDWYLATVIARLVNHEATNEDNYFDGWGYELYAQYRLRGKWWLIGGGNWLSPDGDQRQAGDFRVKYGLIGLRYALRDFDRFLYVNLRADRSLDQRGSALGNVVTAGLRWNF